MRLTLLLTSLLLLLACQPQPDYVQGIRQQLDGMEAAWASGDKASIADFYTDDSFMIGPRGILAHGHEQIVGYWAGVRRTPVEWILTDYVTTQDVQDILDSKHWKSTNAEFLDWDTHGVKLPEDAVYQLGQSELIGEREGKIDTSTVDFVLIWKKTENAYQIFVDTYN